MLADLGLTGRRILVTGASAGIGRAVVLDLRARGALVAAVARSNQGLDELARETGAIPIPADLEEPDKAERAVQSAAARLGGLDALVNNAGVFLLGAIADGRIADWQRMLSLNVLGMLATARAAIPFLADSDTGQIINMSSMSGRRVPSVTGGVYAATKHALVAVSDALRAEVFTRGIKITVISPGVVRTNYGAYIADPQVRGDAATGQRDLGLRPERVAEQVAYVLSQPPDVHMIEIALMSDRQPPSP